MSGLSSEAVKVLECFQSTAVGSERVSAKGHLVCVAAPRSRFSRLPPFAPCGGGKGQTVQLFWGARTAGRRTPSNLPGIPFPRHDPERPVPCCTLPAKPYQQQQQPTSQRAMLRSAVARRSRELRRLLSSSAAGGRGRSAGPLHRAQARQRHPQRPMVQQAQDTAFPLTERDRLGLRGLLPPRVMTFKEQYERFMNSFKSLENNTRGEPDSIVSLGQVLIDNIKDFAPIIYTPTVGLVDMIVVTDGSRILGLGDLGVQGIGIPIGKLDLYVAAAGINPQKVLPVMLDVGTNNNEKLLEDKLYLGLRQHRLEGEEYLSVIDEFMEAVRARWPKAVVQFEDFQMKWAFETLQRAQPELLLLAYLVLSEHRADPFMTSIKQKIVVVGAGRALLPKDRKGLDPAVAPFARGHGPDEIKDLHEGASLVEVFDTDHQVKKVKPHVLLGLSGVGGIFNEEVLRAMKDSESPRPAIFAMSNPTTKAECTPEDVFKHVGENAIFASGSPFSDVSLGNGKTGYANQANNMYLFPGIGLGALLSGARNISDEMLQAAAESLASYITDEEIGKGILFPSVSSIRPITARVGAAVVRAAIHEDLAEGTADMGPKELNSLSEPEIVDYVARKMWYPIYSPLVSNK
ncbi:hypothetical protein PR202_ga07501 [Eleusine coracana subsp. coracana]|uniref:Malic enzyme n=1 Tax=Eleusine coracana subsp. coracana TaxID=191504 RepID=A0AAV5BXP5_ELECO|nr:hypothetical protein PR202_ga07501 [Eleusine coracana subsp. coracana]